MEIWEKLDFCQKIPENLDFGQIFRKSRFFWKFSYMALLVKIIENLNFGQNFCKSRFGQNFQKISILVEIFEKSRIRSKLLEDIELWSKFPKISILVKILQ